jgi:hypothetical protein
MSTMCLKGRLEVEVDWRALAEWLKYEVPARYVGGTTVPEPDVSSVSTAEVVSVAGVVTSVAEDNKNER